MKTHYTAQEIADATGHTERAVQLKAKKDGWPVETQTGRGGAKHLYPFSALPEDWKIRLSQKRLAEESRAVTVPAGPRGGLSPQELTKAGLRADLVRHFDEASGRPSPGQTAREARAEFVEVYNTGHLYPRLYEALGQTSATTLYRWSKQLRDANYDCLVLADARGGHNRGTYKITQEEAAVLRVILLHQNKVKIETAIKYSKLILESRGVESPSGKATMRRYAKRLRERYYDLWVLAREGEKALLDKVLPYIERNPDLLAVGDVLVADGHVCNYRIINPFDGKPVRPSIITFMDWASRDIAGYTYTLTEDVYAIHTALRNAMVRLGKIPKAVLLDNGKAFKAKVFLENINLEEAGVKGLYGRLGITVALALPYRARSKPVERFFNTLGNQFERLLPSYVGGSIDDKPARMKRNERFMQELAPDSPLTVKEAYARLDEYLDMVYRRQPHDGLEGRFPGEVFEEGRGPGLEGEDLTYLMMHKEDRQIGQNGISFRKGHYWNDLLYGLKERVNIRYDLADRERILVYDRNWDFICEALRVEGVHPLYHLLEGEEKKAAKARIADLSREHGGLKKETKQAVRLVARSAADLGGEDTIWAALTGVPQLPAPDGAAPEPGPEVEPEAEVEEGDRWSELPASLLERPVEMLRWYEGKLAAVGLTPDDEAHVTELLGIHSWLIGYFEDRERDFGTSGSWIQKFVSEERRAVR